MYISPVSINYGATKTHFRKPVKSQINFSGKHDCAKVFGSICAGLGTLGALGGIAIMTGGVSLIPTIAYGAICGGIGAVGGHLVDKAQPEYNDKKKK